MEKKTKKTKKTDEEVGKEMVDLALPVAEEVLKILGDRFEGKGTEDYKEIDLGALALEMTIAGLTYKAAKDEKGASKIADSVRDNVLAFIKSLNRGESSLKKRKLN